MCELLASLEPRCFWHLAAVLACMQELQDAMLVLVLNRWYGLVLGPISSVGNSRGHYSKSSECLQYSEDREIICFGCLIWKEHIKTWLRCARLRKNVILPSLIQGTLDSSDIFRRMMSQEHQLTTCIAKTIGL